MPSVAEQPQKATEETAIAMKDNKFVVRPEPYGFSIEVRDMNSETRFLPPPDTRSTVRKFFERLWLGFKPYRQQSLP